MNKLQSRSDAAFLLSNKLLKIILHFFIGDSQVNHFKDCLLFIFTESIHHRIIFLQCSVFRVHFFKKFISPEQFCLKFIDVKEYSFYYFSHRIFYNVEIYKFFKIDDLFYVSFSAAVGKPPPLECCRRLGFDQRPSIQFKERV